MAHSRPASDTAPRQIEIFAEEGVDLSKVQIAHCGDSPDADYIESLIDKGVWVGLDRYGLEMYLPYDQRQAATLALLERGYADRVFLSADSCASIDWFPAETIEQLIAAGRGQGLGHPHGPAASDPGPARGRDDRRSDRDDHGRQPRSGRAETGT